MGVDGPSAKISILLRMASKWWPASMPSVDAPLTLGFSVSSRTLEAMWLRKLQTWGMGQSVSVVFSSVRYHSKASGTYRFGVPPSTAELKPREVPAEARGAQNSVRVLLELLDGEGLLDGDLEASTWLASFRRNCELHRANSQDRRAR